MRKSSFFLILFVLCSSLIAKEAKLSGKQQMTALQNGIERIILDADPEVHIGIEIVSLKNGQRLYQKSPHHLFVPASCIKLITGAAALHLLGVDYRFTTKLWTDGTIEDTTLKGNLYLQGSGDPDLAVRDLEELVFQLKLQNITTIEGDLFADNTLFDAIAQGPGWMWDDTGYDWSAPMQALTLNRSCIDIWVKPAEKVNTRPRVYQYPKSDFVRVENRAVTTKEENDLIAKRRAMSIDNIIDIGGKMPLNGETRHLAIPVEEPHLYTIHVLRNILLKAKVGFEGKVASRQTPKDAVVLASHTSRPLSQIVEEMMKTSDNLIGDALFKKMGENRFGAPGTWQKGSQAVREFLAQTVGLNVEKMVIVDGSGLSRYNLVSAHHFLEFLSWMHKQFSCSSEFISSLPISGTDGSLVRRMKSGELKGKVRAKTGAMTGISSLSGYLSTKDGELLAFSILQNGFTGKVSEYKTKIEDEICAFLVNFSREE